MFRSLGMIAREFVDRYMWSVQISPVASPAQKKVGVRNFFLCWRAVKFTIYMHGTPPIYKKTFQRICANLRRGLNRSGGVRTPSFPPWRRHWISPRALVTITRFGGGFPWEGSHTKMRRSCPRTVGKLKSSTNPSKAQKNHITWTKLFTADLSKSYQANISNIMLT